MNPSNSSDALAQLQAAQAQSQDPNTILSNQKQQLGVNQAQDTVTGLRGAINSTTKLLQQVAPSVMGRTAGSLVTNAQASKQIQNEQAPISQNLSTEGTQYNQADEDLSKLQDQAQQAASGIYQGQEDKLSYAQNLYNTLFQKEQAAQQQASEQADQQEKIREFNAQLSASQAAAGSGGFNLSAGSGSSPAVGNLTGGRSKSDAQAAVADLLKQNTSTIGSTIQAIQKSAGYGNTYDQAKLELLKAAQPGLFNKDGTLNTSRISALSKIGF